MELNLITLFRELMGDIGVDKKTSMYIQRRLRNEGHTVVTQLLPSFSKHVLACLETGAWSQFTYGGGVPFAARSAGGLPEIFRGFLQRLFVCGEDGVFYSDPNGDPYSLWGIRQVCEYAYKLSLPFTDEQLNAARQKFLEVDASVPTTGEYDSMFVDQMRKNFIAYYPRAATLTVSDCMAAARPGPGTFSMKSEWEKTTGLPWFVRNSLPIRIPYSVRGFAHHLRFNSSLGESEVFLGYSERISELRGRRLSCLKPHYLRTRFFPAIKPLPSTWSPHSEVLFVPKDSRGPRVIVREPFENLYVQMGYNTCMSRSLERDTHYRINFESQEVNRQLAARSSMDGSYATLDLKDASDRISFAIVQHLFRNIPIGRILDVRTQHAALPHILPKIGFDRERLVPLRKLAGMGSGLTFPTMALIIHLSICTHISRALSARYQDVMKEVYVYGDDIIVPSSWYPLARIALQRVGLQLNDSKCFAKSRFRESCGADFYLGRDVRPVRLSLKTLGEPNKPLSVDMANGRVTLRHSNAAMSAFLLERHARELSKLSLHSAENVVLSEVCRILGVSALPLVAETSPVLGRLAERAEVLSTFVSSDGTGTFDEVEVFVPKPKKVRVQKGFLVGNSYSGVHRLKLEQLCSNRLFLTLVGKDSRVRSWDGKDWPTVLSASAVVGEWSIPRAVEIVRTKVSAMALS